jgi:hypothetical protein
VVLQLSQRQRFWGDSTSESLKLVSPSKISSVERANAGTNLNFDIKEPYLVSLVQL